MAAHSTTRQAPAAGADARGAAIAVGPWVKLPTLASLEAVQAAGPDFICIDMCNGWLSIERVADLLALRSPGCRNLVRLAPHATPDIAGQVLDAGADGIVLAHVASAEDAALWVSATRFPPLGTRGMGSTGRAGTWGLGARADYLNRADPDLAGRTTLAVMIEDAEAIRQVDAIASVDGVDQLVVGTADLGAAFPNDTDGFERAIDAVARACATHGRSAAIALGTADRVAELTARGYDTFYISNDITLLARAAQQTFATARASLG